MGNEFHQQGLGGVGQTVDGEVLFGLVQILQACGNHVLGLVQVAEVLHFALHVGFHGVVEKFRFHPAGVHGHHPDAPGPQLPVHGPGIAEDEGFGGAVGGEVRHRLEGGEAVQLQNVAAAVHVGQHDPGHGHQGLTVQIDHPQLVLHGDPMVGAEFAEAGGVDQQLHVGLCLLQQGGQSGEASAVAEVQGDGAHRDGHFLSQSFQGILSAGDDPDLVHGNVIS